MVCETCDQSLLTLCRAWIQAENCPDPLDVVCPNSVVWQKVPEIRIQQSKYRVVDGDARLGCEFLDRADSWSHLVSQLRRIISGHSRTNGRLCYVLHEERKALSEQ